MATGKSASSVAPWGLLATSFWHLCDLPAASSQPPCGLPSTQLHLTSVAFVCIIPPALWASRWFSGSVVKLNNPPGPCGLSRRSSLPSISSFGTKVYLSLKLSPGLPNLLFLLASLAVAPSKNHTKPLVAQQSRPKRNQAKPTT